MDGKLGLCSCGTPLPPSNGTKPRKHCSLKCADHKRRSWMKSSTKATRKRYQERERDSILARRREYNRDRCAENYELIRSLKSGGCIECGESDPVCLDFHHKDPKTKKYLVSQMTMRTRVRILEEAAKCIILCANCHRKLESAKRKRDGIATWQSSQKRLVLSARSAEKH